MTIFTVQKEKIIYLFIGGLNFLAGYLIGVITYITLINVVGILGVGIFGNILAISFSFVMYKFFVFKTSGNWLSEYLKSYLIYGAMAIIGTIFLWIFIDQLNFEIWIAQLLVMISTFVISYFGHKKFTFVSKN